MDISQQPVKNYRFIDRGLPLSDTRWLDNDGRVSRAGFLDGCIERFPIEGHEDETVTIQLLHDPMDLTKTFYVVERSDDSEHSAKMSPEEQRLNPNPGMYKTTSLKEARKVCTYFRFDHFLVEGKMV